MPWRQLKLRLRAEELEAAEALLWQHGALSVSNSDASGKDDTSEPLFELEPGDVPLWDRLLLTALFSQEAELGDLCRELRSDFPDSAAEIETLAEQRWERVWLEGFRPMQFGERLWVCPSGHAPPDPAAVNVMLDPGLAFGTGTHPTTAMCLRRLASVPREGLGVIDYGCGSGILAIAAALLGAWPVFAVDHDAHALTACRENCRRNNLTETRVMTVSPEQLPALQADLLLANILAGPLLALRERFQALVRPGGAIVLSGILDEQANRLRRAYGESFDIEPVITEGEWALLAGRLKSSV